MRLIDMTARERLLNVLGFERGVRTLKWEFGYWADTMKRWYREGLPRKKGMPEGLKGGEELFGEGIPWKEGGEPFAEDVHNYFGLDEGFERVPVNLLFCPQFEPVVVDRNGEHITIIDNMGITKEVRADELSIPRFIAWPVRTRDDWERIKAERLIPSIDRRLPKDIQKLAARYKVRTYPLTIGGYPHGFFGTARFLMGDETLFTGYYDQPGLIHDINSTLCDLWIRIIAEVLEMGVELDCVDIWEDMSYRSGSLISPAHFKEFMSPYYRKLIGFLKGKGVKHIWVDTDGNCTDLIPLFLDVGVTGLAPMEVQAGMNVVEIRKQYPGLEIFGGLDKRAPAKGYRAVDNELEDKMSFMLKSGGYIPYLDHLIPPDVSWDVFMYYRKKLNAIIDMMGDN